MPRYEITAPDGKRFEITAPEGATQDQVLSYARENAPSAQPAARPKSDQNLYSGLGRQILQGATFGFGDEALAGVQSMIPGWGTYDERLKREREHLADFSEQYPTASTVGQLAGGAALAAVPGLNAISGANAAGRFIQGANTVGQAARRGAAIGAGYGALGGFGAGEDGFGNRLANAAVSAPLAAGAGAALGAAGHKLGQFAGAYRAAQAEAGIGDPSRGAALALERSFARDQIDPAAMRGEMLATGSRAINPDQLAAAVRAVEQGSPVDDVARGLGVNAKTLATHVRRFNEQNASPVNLVDRARMTQAGGGENTSWLMRAAAATPGPARTTAAQKLTERQIGAGPRLLDAVRRTLGDGDIEGRIAQASEALRNAESQAYRAAQAQEKPFNIGPILQAWDRSTQGRQSDIYRTMRDVIGAFYRRHQTVTPDGRMGPIALRPVTTLGEFQRIRATELRSAMDRARASGDKTLLRELTRFKRHIDNVVRQTNPAWAKANDMFADGAAGQRALELGEQMALRLNSRSRDTLRQFERMTEPERELFRQGLSRSIQDRIANKQQTHDVAAELRLPGARQLLERVMGRQQAGQLARAVDEETAMIATYKSLGGSQTTPLREAIDENSSAALMTEALNVLQPRQFLIELARRGAGRINASRNRELMGMLTDESPAAQVELLNRLSRISQGRGTGRMQGLFGAGRALPATGLLGQIPSDRRR